MKPRRLTTLHSKYFFRRLDKIIDCWNVSTSKWDINWNGGRKMMALSHANWTQLQPHHRRWLLSGKNRRIHGCPFGKSSTTRDIFHLHVHQSLDVFLILYIHEYPRIPCFPWFPIPHFPHIFMATAEKSNPRNERLAGLLARGGASAGNFPGESAFPSSDSAPKRCWNRQDLKSNPQKKIEQSKSSLDSLDCGKLFFLYLFWELHIVEVST